MQLTSVVESSRGTTTCSKTELGNVHSAKKDQIIALSTKIAELQAKIENQSKHVTAFANSGNKGNHSQLGYWRQRRLHSLLRARSVHCRKMVFD
jgi:hypothetical protein